MKKYKYYIYLLSIIVTLIMSYFIYKSFSKNDNDNISKKVVSEVKFIEGRLIDIFNQMNNIEYVNYRISSTIISKEEEKTQSSAESSSTNSSSSENSTSSKTSSSSEESSNKNNSDNNTSKKKYELKKKGILTQDSDINWTNVKNQVEDMYELLSTMTLDLYQTDINKEKIVNFNSEFDNLTKVVKAENKEQTLSQLSILYDNLPEFLEKCNIDKKTKTIIRTKNNILKAYSRLDNDDWVSMADNINNAVQEYSNLVTDTNEDEKVQAQINKTYIKINELQNAINLKDQDIFLIKYKILLEDLDKI